MMNAEERDEWRKEAVGKFRAVGEGGLTAFSGSFQGQERYVALRAGYGLFKWPPPELDALL